MQKAGRITLISAGVLLIVLPVLLFLTLWVDERKADPVFMAEISQNFLLDKVWLVISLLLPGSASFIGFFKEFYLPVLPGIILLGAGFFYNHKLLPEKGGWQGRDFLWVGVLTIGVLFFFLAYSAGPGSVFHRVESLIPALGAITPDLFTFTVWISFFLIATGSIFVYFTLIRMKYDRAVTGALLIAVLTAFFFSVGLVRVPFIQTLEEATVAFRFTWVRNPGATRHAESNMPYCPAPYDVAGKKVDLTPPAPEGIRDDIQIIGISNRTIEDLHGDWPLDWSHYARLLDRLGPAPGNIQLFDISFLDEKGIFGGNYCGRYFNCTPIGGYELRNQVDILAEAIARADNIVLADYPMETTDEARSSIVNYEDRMEKLRAKERMTNIKNARYAMVWARLPLPPVAKLTEALDGVGYANILKDIESGMNRKVPLVIRIQNLERARQSDYNPDVDDEFYPGIDLTIAAKYYGIDEKKDIEVDWLRGTITLSNIPPRTFQKLNLQTLEEETIDVMKRPNPERSVVIPINRLGQMNINFRGGRYCFKFWEILETNRMRPEDSASIFKDKITLTAMYYATGVGAAKDMHLSPYGDMAGIEHHAYALNTLLNQDFLRDAPPLVNLIILLTVALIMGFYQPRVKTWMSFVLFLAIAFIFTLLTVYVSFDSWSLLHVFPTVILEQFIILIGFIGFRALTEEENVKFIRNTFSKFVSQDVVNELLANPEAIALGGAKRDISVLFSDVRGFTTISEKLGPEELVNLLNEYLSTMTDLIIEYRGTIDKYMGDAIMAFWGAPVQNDDHAYYTCVAALAQYEALKELQKRWSEKEIPVLDIGIGINSGAAVVGNMGSSHRMDYTLMGDTVNLGSRLEGITKTYGVKICISEFTYERVKDRVYARELDLVRVKGKLEPVRIYELMGLRNANDMQTLKKGQLSRS